MAHPTGPEHHGWKGSDVAPNTGRERAARLYELGQCERCPEPAVDRHHRDGDTTNNAPENVEGLCRRCHMEADGRLGKLRNSQRRKLTQGQADEIRARYAAIPKVGSRRPRGSVAALAEEFGVSPTTVKLIGTGKRWAPMEAAA